MICDETNNYKGELSMAQKQSNTNLSTLLFGFMNQPDPMLSILEWLCEQMIEAEVSMKLSADGRSGYRSGYRPRRLDTRLGPDLSYGSQSPSGRLYSILRERLQA